MATDKKIPDTWITIDTLKTVSGSAACAWALAFFLDLVIFKQFNEPARTTAANVTGIVGSLFFAIIKIAGSAKKEKLHWALAVPNAVLIYVHSLGFQVATKEVAAQLNPPRDTTSATKPTKSHSSPAGFFDFLSIFSQQASWLPDHSLKLKIRKVEASRDSVLLINASLIKQITQLKTPNGEALPFESTSLKAARDSVQQLLIEQVNSRREISRVNLQNGKLDSTNDALNKKISQLQTQLSMANTDISNLTDKLNRGNTNADDKKTITDLRYQLTQLQAKYNALLSAVRSFDALQQKWPQRVSQQAGVQRQAMIIEKTMDEYMGQGYYKSLFTPIKTQDR